MQDLINGSTMKKTLKDIIICFVICIFLNGCGLHKTKPSSSKQEDQNQTQSSETQESYISSMDYDRTDFVPLNFLEEPGEIMGTWFSAVNSEKMKVSVDDQILRSTECKKWPEDCLIISFPETEREPVSFKAAHGDFLVYGFDTDGDGIKEIAIESIESRDSDIKTLRVLKLIKNEYAEVFRAPLNGVFTYASESGNGYESIKWERKYGLKSSFTGKRFDIVLYLNKPDEKLTRITQLNDLFIYQCKKITAVYDDKNSTYVIKNADPIPIGK